MSKIQIKSIGDKVYFNRQEKPVGDESQTWTLTIEEASSILSDNAGALRVAITQATIVGKESRRAEIERLEMRIKELRKLDQPPPEPNAAAIKKIKTMYSIPENPQ